jgi:murein DD-endopeptidase MepM/ murein hydrolase activator NlpD
VAIATCALALTASTASAGSPVPGGAQISGGGVPAPGIPVVQRVFCKTGCLSRLTATVGALIKIKGESLDYVRQIVFRGVAGPMPVPVTYASSNYLKAIVPAGALSSRPYVVDRRGRRSNRSRLVLTVRPAPVPAQPTTGVFPVRGPHTYGDGFGVQRSGHTHQGQDILAACGTPLVSVMNATVQYVGYQAGGAGNYIVLDNNGIVDDFVYMHLATPAYVKTGAPVAAAQQIGTVGQTGDATGCHLHFEYWQGDWFGGGHPIDPLPYLKAWDTGS